MSGDFPTMLASTYGSSSSTTALDGFSNNTASLTDTAEQLNSLMAMPRVRGRIFSPFETHESINPQTQEQVMARRVVQVYIADPNENIPLEDSLIYQGSQKLTDSTDQELFYEIDIKNLLDAYNVKRVKIVDKKVKERTQYLEPVKIRELKMVVVTVASF